MEGIRPSLKTWLEFVTFEHTIFALPFAYLGAILAARGVPPFSKWVWMTLAMVGARTAGMGLNRIIDREIDAKNPRTKNRPLQRGEIRLSWARLLVLCSILLLLFAAWRLNPLCLVLSPLALFFLSTYSYMKRFSWATHFVLGLVLACAPVGGWIAVTGQIGATPVLLGGAVLFWVAGFDVIYTCQDVVFDREAGVHSLPVRVGVARALFFSGLFHGLSFLFLFAVGLLNASGLFFWIGLGMVSFILFIEHRMISPRDLSRVNRAFFVMNGWVSVVLFIAVFADRVWFR